ncbi:Uncharacterised protein [Kluyvera cryocrescens]|uniref:Uncharacterized protein n=1 Tax=Kluyvera cryocrescens TaxID=580 RepID=A0A485A892_KLUCR|nr:Uncharacterised protein [Kluyvera cryocrescens]
MFEFIGFLFCFWCVMSLYKWLLSGCFLNMEYGKRRNDTVEIHQQKMRICYGELEVV